MAVKQGERVTPNDLFAETRLESVTKPLTVFRAELTGCENVGWEDLFAGFTTLKAITFSSSIELLLRLAQQLEDMEVVFGSESILSKEHLALAQASQTVEAYGFADALIDHKVLVEALSRLLSQWSYQRNISPRSARSGRSGCAGPVSTIFFGAAILLK